MICSQRSYTLRCCLQGLHKQAGQFQERILIAKERQLAALHEAQKLVEEDNQMAHAKIEALTRQERQVLAQYNSCQLELQRCRQELKMTRRRASATTLASERQVDAVAPAPGLAPAPEPARPLIPGFESPETTQPAELVTPTRVPERQMTGPSQATLPPGTQGDLDSNSGTNPADDDDTPAAVVSSITPLIAAVTQKKAN